MRITLRRLYCPCRWLLRSEVHQGLDDARTYTRTHTRIHAFPSTRPSHSLSLPLSPRVSAPLLFSYTPFRQCYRLSLSSSAEPLSLPPITRTIYQRSARFTLGISCPLYRRSFPYIRPPSPFPLGFPKHLFATEIKHQGAALDRSCKTKLFETSSFFVFQHRNQCQRVNKFSKQRR